jgi:hypothetical protein
MRLDEKKQRCVLFLDSPRRTPSVIRLGRQRLDILCTTHPREVEKLLGPPGSAVLLLVSWKRSSITLIKRLRAKKTWASLPIFLLDEKVKMPAAFKIQAAELLPKEKFLETLRKAGTAWRDAVRGSTIDRRKHSRVALRVAAFCRIESVTVDLSEGGVCFLTSHPYRIGERGLLDVEPLNQELGKPLFFTVVATEKLPVGELNYRVHAQFIQTDRKISALIRRTLSCLAPKEV